MRCGSGRFVCGDQETVDGFTRFVAQDQVFDLHIFEACVAAQCHDVAALVGVAAIALQHEVWAVFWRDFA